MTQEEFFVTFWKMLNADSSKSNPSALSRTFMDREAEVFGKHLWEFFTAQGAGETLDETWLTLALLKTHRKYTSEQERAAAIMALRGKAK